MKKSTARTCEKRHKYFKSSDCPNCPICESKKVPEADFLVTISAPARRALERENITTLKKLSQYSEKEILAFHGVGPSTIPKLKKGLKTEDFGFKK